MEAFSRYDIDNGEGLRIFIIASGLKEKGSSGLEGANNVIRIPDLTSFNWKANEDAVRINCKENAMHVIERYTSLKHFDNGDGDPPRPYSFYARTLSDLMDVIYALKTIEGNK